MQLCRVARHAGRLPARAQRALPGTRLGNATTAVTNTRRLRQARSLATASQAALPRATPSQQSVEIKWSGHHAGSLESPSTGGPPVTAKRDILPNIWLRDNCRCSLCINQDTMQKDLDTFQIPKDLRANKIEETTDGLKIQWSGPDAHESIYPWDFLQFYLENDRRQPETVKLEKFGSAGPSDSKRLSFKDFYADGQELKGEEADRVVGRLTDLIARHGLVFIDDVPTTSGEPTQRLLEKIAFIRETHYGGFYDFIPDLAMADTAYTNIALPAHTDNTYFSDPAGLQAFHMLSHTAADDTNSSSGADLGGQSLLVDGFHAAEILRGEDPRAFDVLCTVKLPWHASGNKGITIAPHRRYPVFELADDAEGGGLHRIRWNTADRGVVPFWEDAAGRIEPEEWYDAARKFDEILRRKDVEFWVQLRPGTLLVFDNWRVLHGRAAFTGVRRMCGGYINRDDYISRWRNTNFSRQEIMDKIVG